MDGHYTKEGITNDLESLQGGYWRRNTDRC